MAFPGMDHQGAELAEGLEHALAGPDRGRELANVIPQRGAKAAGLRKSRCMSRTTSAARSRLIPRVETGSASIGVWT